MMLRLTDGGRLIREADGTIVRYSAAGTPLESLRPSDSGYSYWLGLLYSAAKKPVPDTRQR